MSMIPFFYPPDCSIKEGMDKKPLFAVLSFLLLFQFPFVLHPSPKATKKIILSAVQSPEYWELHILIKSKGAYEIKEGEKDYKGQYTYSARWTGCLEEDDSDFLIYFEDEKLLKWEAQEKAKNPDGASQLSTADFSAKPEFEFNYLIKKEEGIDFDFSVIGFEVPLSISEIKHPLTLPASAEHTERTVDNYYSHNIVRGSNRIRMPNQAFYKNRSSQSFSWNWEHQGWTKIDDRVVFYAQSHAVDVEVTIITHYSRSKKD